MSPLELSDADDALVEECIDELDAAIEKLDRFSETVLLRALAAHVGGLLRALADSGKMTQEAVAQFSASVAAELTQGDGDS
jgi:hypothetical protein